jgi:hypothetical protein
MLPKHCVYGLTRAAIESLTDDGFLVLEGRQYYISQVAIRSIEIDLAQPDSFIARLSRGEASSGDQPKSPDISLAIPASDRVVTLDHNSHPYNEAIAALDAAVTAFREDHRLENDWGPEKGILLRSIEGGQQLLKETEVRVATLFTTIIHPLRIILDRYRDAVAASLITAGVDHLISTIERAVSSVLTLIGVS